MKPHLAILLQTVLLASSQVQDWREAPGQATEAHFRDSSASQNARNVPGQAAEAHFRGDSSSFQNWREAQGQVAEAHFRRDSSASQNWRDAALNGYTRQSRSQSQDWNAPTVAHEQGVRQGEAQLRGSRMDGLRKLAKVRTDNEVVGDWSRGARGEVTEQTNELSAKGQTNADKLHPSHREMAARKKKKPAVSALYYECPSLKKSENTNGSRVTIIINFSTSARKLVDILFVFLT